MNPARMRLLLLRSLIALAICAGLVVVCYFFVDRQVAFFVHDHHLNRYAFLEWLTYPPIWCQAAAPAIIILAVVRMAWKPLTRFETFLFAGAVNLLVTLGLKDMLKFVFGRYWPETWIDNNPSLIGDDAYGFHPFHAADAYGDFPSGHTARIVSVMAVLWIAFPAWWSRSLAVVISGAVVVGLVGMNYHFVGDTVAGAFLASITGMYAAYFFQLDRTKQ